MNLDQWVRLGSAAQARHIAHWGPPPPGWPLAWVGPAPGAVPDHDPYEAMQEWAAWDAAAELAEQNQLTAVKQRRRETVRNWAASWGTATLTVLTIVLPLISLLVAVAIEH